MRIAFSSNRFFGDEGARRDQSCRLVEKVNAKLAECGWMEKDPNVLTLRRILCFNHEVLL